MPRFRLLAALDSMPTLKSSAQNIRICVSSAAVISCKNDSVFSFPGTGSVNIAKLIVAAARKPARGVLHYHALISFFFFLTIKTTNNSSMKRDVTGQLVLNMSSLRHKLASSTEFGGRCLSFLIVCKK